MGKRSDFSNKRRTAVAEQWNGPAYISDGQGKAFGEETVAQQLHPFRHEFKEGMQMMQSTWWEQRQSQQDGWYTREQWGEHMRSQWEERQWDEDKWSQRKDPLRDQQRRSTRQTRNKWGGWNCSLF